MMEEQKKLGLEEGGGGCSNGREKVVLVYLYLNTLEWW
jgi:hypothetical protein